MSQSSFEQVLKEVQALPPEDVSRLREILNAPAETEQQNGVSRANVRAASLRDFTADRQWLADHRDEYAGQWVALKDGQLISHGKDHLAVHREAKAAGHQDALLVLVEASDAPPFIL